MLAYNDTDAELFRLKELIVTKGVVKLLKCESQGVDSDIRLLYPYEVKAYKD